MGGAGVVVGVRCAGMFGSLASLARAATQAGSVRKLRRPAAPVQPAAPLPASSRRPRRRGSAAWGPSRASCRCLHRAAAGCGLAPPTWGTPCRAAAAAAGPPRPCSGVGAGCAAQCPLQRPAAAPRHCTAGQEGCATRKQEKLWRPHFLPRLRRSDRPLRAWLTMLWAPGRPLRALRRGTATLSSASEVRSMVAAPCAGPAARRAAGTMLDECSTRGEHHATRLRCRHWAFGGGPCTAALLLHRVAINCAIV